MTYKRPQKYRETSDYAAMMRRMIKAHARRVVAGNLEDLAELVAIRTDLDDAIDQAARQMYDQGHSWAEIGRVLGITRQSARERFGRPVAS